MLWFGIAPESGSIRPAHQNDSSSGTLRPPPPISPRHCSGYFNTASHSMPLSASFTQYTTPRNTWSTSCKPLPARTIFKRSLWNPPRISNPPPPRLAAYLVVQGLFIVLGLDYFAAFALRQPAITTTVLQGLKISKPPATFSVVHQHWTRRRRRVVARAQDGLRKVPEAREAN